ncbi:hypothetical protein B2G71_01300 [Novosphingobium sp. PC22D]|uniref:DUF805 domain-containing protein n=1 Tax=Novosphingobium sp. PC22D TaxID=1962403 RepID=UPI000BEF965F|nr:DUF805 domain-containing protein [Novosphingobium sp. PC22D]PEQ14272.1 hypothetical protein B2G71_01300 [Novosphingobium sp. PC22D]
MEWMLMPYKRYFDFEGRSRRKEYWMFALLFAIVYAVGFTIMMAGGMSFSEYGATPGAGFYIGALLVGLFALASIIPAIAVQVRRFHDQDKSGWFVLLNFIPYIGGIVVLVFMCLEGTRGPNRFGPDPKDPANASAFA